MPFFLCFGALALSLLVVVKLLPYLKLRRERRAERAARIAKANAEYHAITTNILRKYEKELEEKDAERRKSLDAQFDKFKRGIEDNCKEYDRFIDKLLKGKETRQAEKEEFDRLCARADTKAALLLTRMVASMRMLASLPPVTAAPDSSVPSTARPSVRRLYQGRGRTLYGRRDSGYDLQ